jgi:C4-type Zn-finger protein
MSFQVAIAQEKTVSEEPSGKYDEQIQHNINEQLLSKILILEKEIKSQLEKQNKKFHSVAQFYTDAELEKITILLPNFTSKSYIICNKAMLLEISKSHPNETIIYIDILSSALYKINIKK